MPERALLLLLVDEVVMRFKNNLEAKYIVLFRINV